MALDKHLLSLDRYSIRELTALAKQKPLLGLTGDVAALIARGAEVIPQRGARHELERLHFDHVLAHARVGEPASEHLSRLTVLVKLLTVRGGHTGISLPTVQRMIDFWNHGVLPALPTRDTAASLDLSPLSQMAMPLLGLGYVHYRGEIADTARVFAELGWHAHRVLPRDGLALTNGIQYLMAIGVEAAAHVEQLASLSLRNAANERADAIQCNLHVSARALAKRGIATITNECNGIYGEPLFSPEDEAAPFGGATHFESVALALDLLAVAARELAVVTERRPEVQRGRES